MMVVDETDRCAASMTEDGGPVVLICLSYLGNYLYSALSVLCAPGYKGYLSRAIHSRRT